jgi:hypothetical protein
MIKTVLVQCWLNHGIKFLEIMGKHSKTMLVQCWLNHGIPFLEIIENNYQNSVGSMLAKPRD